MLGPQSTPVSSTLFPLASATHRPRITRQAWVSPERVAAASGKVQQLMALQTGTLQLTEAEARAGLVLLPLLAQWTGLKWNMGESGRGLQTADTMGSREWEHEGARVRVQDKIRSLGRLGLCHGCDLKPQRGSAALSIVHDPTMLSGLLTTLTR